MRSPVLSVQLARVGPGRMPLVMRRAYMIRMWSFRPSPRAVAAASGKLLGPRNLPTGRGGEGRQARLDPKNNDRLKPPDR